MKYRKKGKLTLNTFYPVAQYMAVVMVALSYPRLSPVTWLLPGVTGPRWPWPQHAARLPWARLCGAQAAEGRGRARAGGSASHTHRLRASPLGIPFFCPRFARAKGSVLQIRIALSFELGASFLNAISYDAAPCPRKARAIWGVQGRSTWRAGGSASHTHRLRASPLGIPFFCPRIARAKGFGIANMACSQL